MTGWSSTINVEEEREQLLEHVCLRCVCVCVCVCGVVWCKVILSVCVELNTELWLYYWNSFFEAPY